MSRRTDRPLRVEPLEGRNAPSLVLGHGFTAAPSSATASRPTLSEALLAARQKEGHVGHSETAQGTHASWDIKSDKTV